MSNVLNEQKKQQVIALGRLGWSLRRIERRTGVRRETAATHLMAAGVPLRPPGGWGRHDPKPAIEVITDPASVQAPGTFVEDAAPAKPANGVTTDFGAEFDSAETGEPAPAAAPRQVPASPTAKSLSWGSRAAATPWPSGRIWWTPAVSQPDTEVSDASSGNFREAIHRKLAR